MSEIPVDQRRDSATLRRLREVAEGIFQRYGVSFAAAARAGGWSNATWLGGGLALRIAVEPGRDSIRREAQLAALFPPEVGYPPVLETGVTHGFEWSLSKEVQGRNLGELWPALDWDQRLSALRQVWHKVEAVHSVDAAAAAPLTRQRSPFYAPTPPEAQAGLIRLNDQHMLTLHQLVALEDLLDRYWKARAAATQVLNHGDFTIENALWHAGQVVSLLDFEYAQVAPDELDLNELVKLAFTPWGSLDPLPDPGGAGHSRLRELVLELARPMLSHPGSRDLLLGYAILLEIWGLEDRLKYPQDESGVDQAPFYQILGSLADEHGGYLGPVLALCAE